MLMFPAVGAAEQDKQPAKQQDNQAISPGPKEQAVKQAEVLEQKWGIRITNMRLSANDNMIDFRYRVLAPEKAKPLLDRNNKPYILDQVTGARLYVPSSPKIGSMRQKTAKPEQNRIYFVIFANPGKIIKHGGKATVVIGDFRAEDLIVE